MDIFKGIFERIYGEGSLNDDFLISATSAEHLAKTYHQEMVSSSVTLTEWTEQLRRYLVIEQGWLVSASLSIAEEDYAEYFYRGLTPQEAWLEDCSNN